MSDKTTVTMPAEQFVRRMLGEAVQRHLLEEHVELHPESLYQYRCKECGHIEDSAAEVISSTYHMSERRNECSVANLLWLVQQVLGA